MPPRGVNASMCALVESGSESTMPFPRLGELPEPVVELLVMCLADANYDVEAAAASFRSCFGDGDASAEAFTTEAVHSLVREMSCDGTLQFAHASVVNVAQPLSRPRFNPPLRAGTAHPASAVVAPCITPGHTLAPSLEELVSWTLLTEALAVKVMEYLGRKGCFALMAVASALRRLALGIPGLWSEAVFCEDGASGESCETLRTSLLRRLKAYTALHGVHASKLALRNTTLASGTKRSGESLLLASDLLDAGFWQPCCVLRHLVLHSFHQAELGAVLSHATLFSQLVRLDLLECRGVDEQTFTGFSRFPALRELAIWGLKSTRLAPLKKWPGELLSKLQELSLDPLDGATGSWPTLCCGGEGDSHDSLERLHLLTAQPRLAASSLPGTLRLLSLATRSQDRQNPWVAAFLLHDEHVASLLAGLPRLETLILSGHVALGPGAIQLIGASHGSRLQRLGLARCDGLDSAEAAAALCAATWPALRLLEAPGPRFLEGCRLEGLAGGCRCFLPSRQCTLEPRPGGRLGAEELAQQGEEWWEAVLATRPRPLLDCTGSAPCSPNSPMGDLAAPARYLLQPGDFGEVCRGP
mmetsp:Transcript_93568/g.274031  ORF Transcript_93568/g.274031 Transcript_93568/m.274031 type:complete len:586 (+) Transcript_93568:46-1803(+)